MTYMKFSDVQSYFQTNNFVWGGFLYETIDDIRVVSSDQIQRVLSPEQWRTMQIKVSSWIPEGESIQQENPITTFLKSDEGIELLKSILVDKLSVDVDTNNESSCGSNTTYINLRVMFEGDVICRTSCSIS